MSHDSPEQDVLPAELDALHRQLLADGAAWRAQVPPAQPVLTQVRARLLSPTPTRAPAAEPETVSIPTSRRPGEPPAPHPHLTPSARRGLLATCAAVLLVGLIGGVLYSMAGQHSGRTGLAGPTPAPTPTQAPATWQPLTALAGQGQTGVPLLAPSDPAVAYQVQPAMTGGEQTLSRTDDGGTTWHTLPLPQYNGKSVVDLAVRISPSDAQVVFLQGGVFVPHFTPSSCDQFGPTALVPAAVGALAYTGNTAAPTRRAYPLTAPASDGGECSVDYMSTDGGEHWTRLAFPVAGMLLQDGFNAPMLDLNNVQVQGDRLYLTLSVTSSAGWPDQPWRLVTSADGGKSWQTADAELIARHLSPCLFLADAAGVALYASVSPDACRGVSGKPDTLWRSDDAGAHWRQVGTLPGEFTNVVHTADARHPMLVALGAPTETAPAIVQVSSDDGAIWRATSITTVPAGYTYAYDQPPLALDDGTLIAPFSNAPKPASPLTPGPLSVAYFAWKPGRSAWQQVTPNLTYQGQVYSATLQWSRGSQDASVTVVTMTGHVFDPQFAVSRCGLALGTNGG